MFWDNGVSVLVGLVVNGWSNLRPKSGEGTHAQHCLDGQEPETGLRDLE